MLPHLNDVDQGIDAVAPTACLRLGIHLYRQIGLLGIPVQQTDSGDGIPASRNKEPRRSPYQTGQHQHCGGQPSPSGLFSAAC